MGVEEFLISMVIRSLKLQFYLQAKLMSYIPMPQADHYDMQIYQGLGRTYMQRN